MLSAQQISDRLELEQLVVAYAYAIDERAFERLDHIFTPDAHIDYRAAGGIAGGYPEIRKWLPEALAIFPGYMHFNGNFAFEIEGDEARGKVACINPMVLPKADGTPGEGETMFFGLWYLDRYRRTAAGWRIVERVEKRSFDYNMPDAFKQAMKRD
ncbi:nuclear transport factor 2 family protein [Solimonas terrae]|uniref:Nuclear transport factor 2 family protein n=1 Tax=Solimonas terrae TaxID=1396819 RepID=A0A6M2BQQ9_9GAMM|nr:nuclear transport factor 2 family protein [Solimonas terrae]NGY04798.1 nuclear transport factor 2 family protein [Solimonas terrae]